MSKGLWLCSFVLFVITVILYLNLQQLSIRTDDLYSEGQDSLHVLSVKIDSLRDHVYRLEMREVLEIYEVVSKNKNLGIDKGDYSELKGNNTKEDKRLDDLGQVVGSVRVSIEKMKRDIDEIRDRLKDIRDGGSESPKRVFKTVPERVISNNIQIEFLETGKTYEKWDGQVKIFERRASSVKYEEIGQIFVKVIRRSTPLEVLEVVREDAKRRGANGVILDESLSSLQNLLSIMGSCDFRATIIRIR